jgi:hypothetical protein
MKARYQVKSAWKLEKKIQKSGYCGTSSVGRFDSIENLEEQPRRFESQWSLSMNRPFEFERTV